MEPAEPSEDGDVREPESKRPRFRSRSEEDIADIFGEFSDNEDERQVASALYLCGVSEEMARKKAKDVVNPNEATFFEMYGRGEVVRQANTTRRDLNVVGLEAMDLRTTKPDGTPWNFCLRKDRKLAMQMLDEKNPFFVIGSPRVQRSVRGTST